MATNVISELKAYGCDTDAALERFLGNEGMYAKFLTRFLEDPSFAEIKPALDIGDEDSAFKSTHTLKGVAGNLGFTGLYEISADMVEKFRAGVHEAAWARYDELQQEYSKICDIIRA